MSDELSLEAQKFKHHVAGKIIAGHLAAHLDAFGDRLASREGYKGLSGIEAVHYYVMCKFHWLPSQVRAMTGEDLRFALSEELHGFVLSRELSAVHDAVSRESDTSERPASRSGIVARVRKTSRGPRASKSPK
jgi:hypothetical protein